MSLASWLTSLGTLERPTGGRSSTGAKSSGAFVAVTNKSNLPCLAWPVGSGPNLKFQQVTINGDYIIAFASDLTALAGDRITIAGLRYLVNGKLPFASPMVSAEALFCYDVTLQT